MIATLNRFFDDRRGSLVPVFAGLIAMTTGLGALAIDIAKARLLEERLQIIADAAAYAAVLDLPDEAEARDNALRIAQENIQGFYFASAFALGDDDGAALAPAERMIGDGIEFGTWDASAKSFDPDGAPKSAVRVTASLSGDDAMPTLFAGVFGVDAMELEASAVVAKQPNQPCILLLGTEAKALELSGGSSIEMPNCGVQINSSDATAARISGGHLNSSRLCVVGGVSLSGGATTDPAPESDCNPMADPLAGMSAPGFGTCDHVDLVIGGGAQTLSPGVYCGGIESTGGAALSLDPGVYVMKDGMLKNGGGGSVVGDGVAIYFTGTDARSEFSGGGTVRLTAPTSGPLQGFVFYQGPYAEADLKHKISGGGEMYFEGMLYLPDHNVEWSGGSSGTTPPWTTFVAKTFLISGGGTLTIDSDFATSAVPPPVGFGGKGGTSLVR